MSIFVLGIDLGKNVCSLVGLDAGGSVILRRRLRRDGVAEFVGNLPACLVAMEACCGAHHLGRLFEAAGHEVRLMPPEYVRPYVKANKNDDRDAEAIAEAATRPTMRFVPVKSEAQSDVQALHRARSRLVAERTALINHLRALLLERGIVAPKGRKRLEPSWRCLRTRRPRPSRGASACSWRICGPTGADWTSGSRRSMPSLSKWRERTLRHVAFQRFPGSG